MLLSQYVKMCVGLCSLHIRAAASFKLHARSHDSATSRWADVSVGLSLRVIHVKMWK